MVDEIFDEKCPVCGSMDLNYDCIEPHDEVIIQYVICLECDATFDIYSSSNWKIYGESIDNGKTNQANIFQEHS